MFASEAALQGRHVINPSWDRWQETPKLAKTKIRSKAIDVRQQILQ
jgi:hypothetical protein